MFEIELKAHLADRSAAADRLNAFAVYAGFTEKSDTYWVMAQAVTQVSALIDTQMSTANEIPAIRVRETRLKDSGGETIVTFKKKELRNGVEVNNETEFTVSGREEFETLLRALTFSPKIRKRKATDSWHYENALIEISAVEGLGDFIEIELLSETDDPETVAEYTRRLHEILEQTGVPQSAIEPRYYTEMLTAAETVSAGQ
jgi:adenylate cyclase class 2